MMRWRMMRRLMVRLSAAALLWLARRAVAVADRLLCVPGALPGAVPGRPRLPVTADLIYLRTAADGQGAAEVVVSLPGMVVAKTLTPRALADLTAEAATLMRRAQRGAL